MNINTVARAIADLNGGVILATVDIAVQPEKVFQALSTEETLSWWGDDHCRTTEWDADVRVGGAWRAGGVLADGSPYSVQGQYLEVDPPRKLVFTWLADWDNVGFPTTVSYFLEPISGGTRLTLRHEGFGENRSSCESYASGWERVLGMLAAYRQVSPI